MRANSTKQDWMKRSAVAHAVEVNLQRFIRKPLVAALPRCYAPVRHELHLAAQDVHDIVPVRLKVVVRVVEYPHCLGRINMTVALVCNRFNSMVVLVYNTNHCADHCPLRGGGKIHNEMA